MRHYSLHIRIAEDINAKHRELKKDESEWAHEGDIWECIFNGKTTINNIKSAAARAQDAGLTVTAFVGIDKGRSIITV